MTTIIQNKHMDLTEPELKRKSLLDSYRLKQPFKVSSGQKYLINSIEKNAKWFNYEDGEKAKANQK